MDKRQGSIDTELEINVDRGTLPSTLAFFGLFVAASHRARFTETSVHCECFLTETSFHCESFLAECAWAKVLKAPPSLQGGIVKMV